MEPSSLLRISNVSPFKGGMLLTQSGPNRKVAAKARLIRLHGGEWLVGECLLARGARYTKGVQIEWVPRLALANSQKRTLEPSQQLTYPK